MTAIAIGANFEFQVRDRRFEQAELSQRPIRDAVQPSTKYTREVRQIGQPVAISHGPVGSVSTAVVPSNFCRRKVALLFRNVAQQGC
jgi:hypothetical protein